MLMVVSAVWIMKCCVGVAQETNWCGCRKEIFPKRMTVSAVTSKVKIYLSRGKYRINLCLVQAASPHVALQKLASAT
jgi:hypothetical protein